jgi:hypothetical protein
VCREVLQISLFFFCFFALLISLAGGCIGVIVNVCFLVVRVWYLGLDLGVKAHDSLQMPGAIQARFGVCGLPAMSCMARLFYLHFAISLSFFFCHFCVLCVFLDRVGVWAWDGEATKRQGKLQQDNNSRRVLLTNKRIRMNQWAAKPRRDKKDTELVSSTFMYSNRIIIEPGRGQEKGKQQGNGIGNSNKTPQEASTNN